MQNQFANHFSLLITGCILFGCAVNQNNTETSASAISEAPVSQSFGLVDVMEVHNPILRTPDKKALKLIQQAGYESRNERGFVDLKHQSGLVAQVTYFTEVTDNAIGFGKLKYRKSGNSRAIVSIGGEMYGECDFSKPVGDLSTFSYGVPNAVKHGDEVDIGSVAAGPIKMRVVSRREDLNDRGVAAKTILGEYFKDWHEYKIGDQVVAQRILRPDPFVEFSLNLSPEAQLCIVADMNYRLVKERLAEQGTGKNTVYLVVPPSR